MPLTGGATLDITVGEYFTPNGHNLGAGGVKEGKGITPNIHASGAQALRAAERAVAGEIR
jgi:C-terminal processing protease CtpA/Prc